MKVHPSFSLSNNPYIDLFTRTIIEKRVQELTAILRNPRTDSGCRQEMAKRVDLFNNQRVPVGLLALVKTCIIPQSEHKMWKEELRHWPRQDAVQQVIVSEKNTFLSCNLKEHLVSEVSYPKEKESFSALLEQLDIALGTSPYTADHLMREVKSWMEEAKQESSPTPERTRELLHELEEILVDPIDYEDLSEPMLCSDTRTYSRQTLVRLQISPFTRQPFTVIGPNEKASEVQTWIKKQN